MHWLIWICSAFHFYFGFASFLYLNLFRFNHSLQLPLLLHWNVTFWLFKFAHSADLIVLPNVSNSLQCSAMNWLHFAVFYFWIVTLSSLLALRSAGAERPCLSQTLHRAQNGWACLAGWLKLSLCFHLSTSHALAEENRTTVSLCHIPLLWFSANQRVQER